MTAAPAKKKTGCVHVRDWTHEAMGWCVDAYDAHGAWVGSRIGFHSIEAARKCARAWRRKRLANEARK